MTRWLHNNKGFTLTELIVVITVIGILMGGVAMSLTSHSKNARDTRRKTDLQQIKSALEFYRSNNVNGIYPQSAGGTVNTRYKRVIGGVTTYELVESGEMDEVPIDPLSNLESSPPTIIDYVYAPTTSAGLACDNVAAATYCTTYTVTATLEGGGTYSITPLSSN